MNPEDKRYFYDMVATVNEKLMHRQEGSLTREYFPDTRLKEIENKIARSEAKDLDLAYWQPFFLFLKNASEVEINAFDDDLRMVSDRMPQGKSQACKFLKDESEGDSSWMGGLFEVFVKSALLKSDLLSVDALDWKQSNSKVIDAKVTIGQCTIGVEMTTLGESDQSKLRWRNHCGVFDEDSNESFYDRQDAYTQGRRLFDKVYEKIAPECDVTKSQLLPKAPNLLLIGLSPLISDLSSRSSSIGWALDELFASQPNGNKSKEISLEVFLQRKLKGSSALLGKLLAAPRQVSGILLFGGCKLDHTRINYNAAAECRMSHGEMAIIESILAQPPVYCR
jgi:hypothetical protein